MKPTSLNIHADLIKACRSNNAQAQQELYGLYARAMLNTAFRIVGNVEDAEDVLQESFINAFRNIHSYREEAAFGAWLKRIVVNQAISLINQRMEQILLEDVEIPLENSGGSEKMEMDMLGIDEVKAAVMGLPKGF